MNDDNSSEDDGAIGDTPDSPLQQNLQSGATWMRGLFMLVSCVCASVATFAGSVIVVFGFFWVLFTGEVNQQVREAGQSVARYLYDIARYITYNTDDKPFPLGGAWPSGNTD